MSELCVYYLQLDLKNLYGVCARNPLLSCDGKLDTCQVGEPVPYDPDVKLHVSEIYPAISGEGASTGMTCAIVRLVGCNHKCTYCDSKYAYEGGESLTVAEIIKKLNAIDIKTILLTGGEPLLQKDGVLSLLRAFIEHKFITYVETNGSIDIRPFKWSAHLVMDVKCPSSGMVSRNYLKNLDNITSGDEVKFVIGTREDYDYANSIIREYDLLRKTPNIWISPIWSSDDKTFMQNLSNWMIEGKSTVRLMLQQHKVIWDANKRGV